MSSVFEACYFFVRFYPSFEVLVCYCLFCGCGEFEEIEVLFLSPYGELD